jgi:hypothetical protein
MDTDPPPASGWTHEAVPLDEFADYLERHRLRVARVAWTDGQTWVYCLPLDGPSSEPNGSDNNPTRNRL